MTLFATACSTPAEWAEKFPGISPDVIRHLAQSPETLLADVPAHIAAAFIAAPEQLFHTIH